MDGKKITIIVALLLAVTLVFALSTSNFGNIYVKGNATFNGSYINLTNGIYYGNGSGLTDVTDSTTATAPWLILTGSTMSWNSTKGDATYIALADEGDLNVNNSATCDLADESIAMNWTGLDNYPAACGSGAITQLNDSVTCTDAWVELTGDTMTGNLINEDNITAEYFKLENDPENHTIYDNVNCTIITGDTSELRVC